MRGGAARIFRSEVPGIFTAGQVADEVGDVRAGNGAAVAGNIEEKNAVRGAPVAFTGAKERA